MSLRKREAGFRQSGRAYGPIPLPPAPAVPTGNRSACVKFLYAKMSTGGTDPSRSATSRTMTVGTSAGGHACAGRVAAGATFFATATGGADPPAGDPRPPLPEPDPATEPATVVPEKPCCAEPEKEDPPEPTLVIAPTEPALAAAVGMTASDGGNAFSSSRCSSFEPGSLMHSFSSAFPGREPDPQNTDLLCLSNDENRY
eukprot:g11477.t1